MANNFSLLDGGRTRTAVQQKWGGAKKSAGMIAPKLPPGVEAFQVNLQSRTGGWLLPKEVQSKMESALGADFSDVRVHVGPEVPALGAIAFTWGSNIHFAPGYYSPHSSHGQRLLAHELAHVVQQRAGRVRNPFNGGVAVVQVQALEAEADRMALRASTVVLDGAASIGSHASRVAKGPANVQRRSGSLQPSYFRSAVGALAAVGGAVAAGVAGVAALPIVAGAAVGASIPYAFDYFQSHRAQNYETAHPGYHSMERHSAWYRPSNMLARTQPAPGAGAHASQMINWQGGNVPQYHTSSQFATENWHLFSIRNGKARLRALLVAAGAAPAAQYRFSIQYPNWTTGYSYTVANPQGAPVSFIFYNFVRLPGPWLPGTPPEDQYLLVQHYPQASAAAAPAANFIDNTRQPI